MAIITISRDSHSRGKEIAEGVARRMGYDCISREIVLGASMHFNIPEIKLYHAIHDAPSILDRFTFGKERYIAFIRAALLGNLRKDDVVYHGLAGHFFVRTVPHALKIRIIADMEDRIQREMEHEKLTRREAVRMLKNDDEQRRKWGLSLYGIDTSDASLYDLVLHVKNMSVENAVDVISHTASLKSFETTPESQKIMDDLALAAQVHAAVVELIPYVEVTADSGKVYLKARAHAQETVLASELEEIARSIPGVRSVAVEVSPISLYTRRI